MPSAAAAAEAESLLRVSDLALERGGRQLFSTLSLSVRRCQLLLVEGANGVGKTSLLRVLAGLSRHGYEGTVQRPVPLLFLGHQPAVKGLLSPRENLRWHPAGDGANAAPAIDAALAAVGLEGYEHEPVHQLSAGQQRRVNLARLHLSRAPLWLLDEPFTAIDRAGVHALQALFARHVDGGGAIVLTSHQPLAMARRVDTLVLGAAA